MKSVNKVILIGNVTRDAELKEVTGGNHVCSFGLATTVSAYQTRFRDRTSVRKAVLIMHAFILPLRLSLAG